MPSIEIQIDESSAVAKLDGASQGVHDALVRAIGPLAAAMAGEAMGLAAAHIRFQGKKPGQYLASIYGGVSDKNGRVLGFVRSGSPLAHLLEDGATIPAHDIFPSAADVLAFAGDAGTVFARAVHSPGATVPAYPAIQPAFDSNVGTIQSTIEEAVMGALK